MGHTASPLKAFVVSASRFQPKVPASYPDLAIQNFAAGKRSAVGSRAILQIALQR